MNCGADEMTITLTHQTVQQRLTPDRPYREFEGVRFTIAIFGFSTAVRVKKFPVFVVTAAILAIIGHTGEFRVKLDHPVFVQTQL